MKLLALALLLVACSGDPAPKLNLGACIHLSGDEFYRTECPGTHSVVGSLKLEGANWPGGPVIEREARRCPDNATTFIAPTLEQWRQGQRVLYCLRSA